MKTPPDPFFAPILAPLSAATIAGVALWLSRASFDVAGTTAAPVRVAMLPSLAELMGFVALALLIAAGMASLVRTSRAFWEPATDALLPLFALSLLVLPYLPWIADWIPALRLFAGPGRMLIWILVIGQVLWVFLPLLAKRSGVHAPVMSRSRAAALFGIVSVALSAPFVLNVRALPVDVHGRVQFHQGTALRDAVSCARRQPRRVVRPGIRNHRLRAGAAARVPRPCRHAARTIASTARGRIGCGVTRSDCASRVSGPVVEQVHDAGPAGVPVASSSCGAHRVAVRAARAELPAQKRARRHCCSSASP